MACSSVFSFVIPTQFLLDNWEAQEDNVLSQKKGLNLLLKKSAMIPMEKEM